MYADKVTPSMAAAIDETNRRREKQIAYNEANGIDPQPLRKKIADITEMLAREDETTQELLQTWADAGVKGRAGGVRPRKGAPTPALRQSDIGGHAAELAGLPSSDLAELIQDLTDQMKAAATELQFELAARLRDEISELRKELRQMVEATK
jgi:excinuclease ABC subunit B